MGQRLTLSGWAHRRRDHGGLVFVDLRDHTGLCQLVDQPRARARRVRGRARRAQRVRAACGGRGRCPRARAREPEPRDGRGRAARGDARDRLDVAATPVPARRGGRRRDCCGCGTAGSTCGATSCSGTSALRTQMVADHPASRWKRQGFLDIQTPGSRFKPTPEGARDFLVPSSPAARPLLRAAAVAADPQAAARRRRVRPLLPDRRSASGTRTSAPIGSSGVHASSTSRSRSLTARGRARGCMERVVQSVWRRVRRPLEPPERPFPRLAYDDAMLRYGSDKPDLRFGLEIEDATEVTRGSEFKVFAGAPAVRFLRRAAAVLARRAREARGGREGVGREGARVPRVGEEGELRSPIAKFLSQAELDAFGAPPASTVLFGADDEPNVERGARRPPPPSRRRARSRRRDDGRVPWILDFPMFHSIEDDAALARSYTIPSRGPLDG